MEFSMPTHAQLALGLRALKTIALVDGDLAAEEVSMMEAVQRTFGAALPVEALAPISPAALAEGVAGAGLRLQLLGGMVVMAMADGEVNRAEADLVKDYAAALDIDDGAVANLERFARGQLLRARLDIGRRQWAPRKLKELAAQDGVGVYIDAVLAMLKMSANGDVARRFVGLGEHAPGTLGRCYFEYTLENQFAFPGEVGGPPEVMIFHDLTHVLSGYGTTPDEEILAATFSAGYSKNEVVNWLVFVLAQFHLGIQMAPNVQTTRNKLDVTRLLVAFRRGAAMNLDLNVDWDPWPVMGESVEVLRQRYNILPVSHFTPGARAAGGM